jgi:hypothetical protein
VLSMSSGDDVETNLGERMDRVERKIQREFELKVKRERRETERQEWDTDRQRKREQERKEAGERTLSSAKGRPRDYSARYPPSPGNRMSNSIHETRALDEQHFNRIDWRPRNSYDALLSNRSNGRSEADGPGPPQARSVHSLKPRVYEG